MKTVIKLALVLAFINALVHGASAYWTFYQFRDGVQQTLIFAGRQPSSTVHAQILQDATELDVPIAPEDLIVRRTETRRFAEASYVQPVELFPNYEYPVTFTFSVTALSQPGLPPDDSSTSLR
jgi:hypothetical protein